MTGWRFWVSAALACGVIMAGAVVALLQWHLGGYQQQVAERLLLLGELRRGAIEQYFSTAEAELQFWSSSRKMLDAQDRLLDVWNTPGEADGARLGYLENNPRPPGAYGALRDAGDGSAYSELHRWLHPSAARFVTERGYYDFFLISPEGDVVFTVEKEADFGTNLLTGPWKDTGLADVFRTARDGYAMRRVASSDMRGYEPSAGAPAMFLGTAMVTEQGRFLGVIAFQLPTSRILAIMNYTAGMGETGETYLVGADLLMRSNSRFTAASTVLQQQVDTPTVHRALGGEQGVDVVLDYRGVEVLSAYLPVEVAGGTWAVMSEMDVEEIAGRAASERPAFEGAIGLVFALSLWSVWYWRSRHLPGDEPGVPERALALGDTSDGPSIEG